MAVLTKWLCVSKESAFTEAGNSALTSSVGLFHGLQGIPRIIGIRSSLALDLVPSPSSWLLANNVGAFFVAGIQKSNRDLRLESCQLLHSG